MNGHSNGMGKEKDRYVPVRRGRGGSGKWLDVVASILEPKLLLAVAPVRMCHRSNMVAEKERISQGIGGAGASEGEDLASSIDTTPGLKLHIL
ncbi:hypothetical protein SBOR_4088 [Sclerotinia borealis F-4128]|uniref:Uncharacterized protein n=1 Tax=Sclerotinia borealis (strain F-4128) TaxID=1432307 RepID=W9CLY0_SCLBF|nr:hypothetical protein SBOR_4088 [Sclerotinia borealis F-4128]